MMVAAGISNARQRQLATMANGVPTPHSSPQSACPVCLLRAMALLGNQDGGRVPCAHVACTDCWQAYIHERLMNGGGHRLQCIACDVIIADAFVAWVLTDCLCLIDCRSALTPDVFQLFKRRAIDSVLTIKNDDGTTMRWCARPTCEAIVKTATAAGPAMFGARVECAQCEQRFWWVVIN